MTDIHIRKHGRAGHIRLDRPDALNALTLAMCHEIEKALDVWAEDDGVKLVIIDSAGD